MAILRKKSETEMPGMNPGDNQAAGADSTATETSATEAESRFDTAAGADDDYTQDYADDVGFDFDSPEFDDDTPMPEWDQDIEDIENVHNGQTVTEAKESTRRDAGYNQTDADFGNRFRDSAAAAGNARTQAAQAGQRQEAGAADTAQAGTPFTDQVAGSAPNVRTGQTGGRGRGGQPAETIDLVEIFYLMWGNLWKIILCLVLGGALAFGYTWYFVTPVYQATAKIYVVSSSSNSVVNLTDLQIGTQLTADYEELILSHELLEDVISSLSLDMTYTELSSLITITNPDDTRILRITVTSPDPVMSRDIANELCAQAIIYLPEIMESAEPNMAEEAVLPTSPSSPSYSRNTLMGAMLGAVACMGILLVLYLMDDTVKSPDDLEKYFGTQPLATVAECPSTPGSKKKNKKKKEKEGASSEPNRTPKKVRAYMEWDNQSTRSLKVNGLPELPFDATEALNQLRVNLGFCGNGIRSIMVTSSVPNEGKSFICMNLWKMMAESGQKTLLIDADLRNSELRSHYGITCDEKVKGIVYYLAGRIPLEEAVYRTNIPNGYMVPLASSVANPSILLENDRFARMIRECSQEFDYILVDTPPLGSVADALNIAAQCDGSVLVVHGGETPRKLIGNSIQLLKRTGTPLLGLVLNRAETNNKAGGYYYRRYYSYGGRYYKKGYGAYGYGSADKKKSKK